MFNKYILVDRNHIPRIMSAKKIHERIMDDNSKLNHIWLTSSSSKIIHICKKENFPAKEAIDIKTAILNCYAELLLNKHNNLIRKTSDMDAVYYAYNSLYGIKNERVEETRKKFLKAIISSATCFSKMSLYPCGNNYINAKMEWSKEKFNEYYPKEEIDFKSLYSILRKDFNKRVKKLEEDGALKEDAEKEKVRIQKHIDEINSQSFEQILTEASLARTLQKGKNKNQFHK